MAALPQVSSLECRKNEPKKYEKGLLRPDGQAGFNTPTGKIELFSTRCAKFGFDGLPVYKPMMEPDGRFNLRMINGARKPYITHSKTRSDAPYLLELEACSTITMHPKDASARGLADGDRVEIFSPFGGPVKANLEVSILVPPGTIDAQYGWKGEEDTQRLVPRPVSYTHLDHHVMPKRNKVFVKTSVLLSFGVPPLGLIEFRLQPHPAGLKPFR